MKGAALVTLFCVAAMGVGITAGWFSERRRARKQAASRAQQLATIELAQHDARTRGEASEGRVGQALLAWARELDPQASLRSGIILRYPASRPDQMSRFEVDHLLITRFGLFLVEVKDWKHPVVIAADGWFVDKPEGRQPVLSPLAQSAPKYRVLRQLADQACTTDRKIAVDSIAVLSHPQVSLPMDAPRQVIVLDDLRYYLRLAYHVAMEVGLPPVDDLQRVTQAIVELHDTDPLAKHHFLLELAAKRQQALDYQALEEARVALCHQAPVEVRPFWRNPWTYVPITIVLFVMLVWMDWASRQKTGMPAASAAQQAMTSSVHAQASASKKEATFVHRKRH